MLPTYRHTYGYEVVAPPPPPPKPVHYTFDACIETPAEDQHSRPLVGLETEVDRVLINREGKHASNHLHRVKSRSL